jgi:DNA polymerase-3 subunit epsilon
MDGTPFVEVPFVVVDVETTGTSPLHGDRVTEVAAVVVERHPERPGLSIREGFHSLVNPERPIPWHITRLTGISDDMVRRAPTFGEIAGDLAAQLVGRVFVAHNAPFDWGFLSAEFARVSPTPLDALALSQLCTVRLSRRLLAHLPRRNLDAVSAHYGVTIDGRHRAAGDAHATAQVLLGLLQDAERHGMYTLEEVQGMLARRTHAAKRTRWGIPRPTDGADGV